jgi:hypothetical protein
LILVCAACEASDNKVRQPTIPTVVLTQAEVEFPESFADITGIRELKDGRLIVAYINEETVELVDLATGQATRIGRTGSGPGEYKLPSAVHALGGDSTGVLDGAKGRWLVLLPDATTGGFISPAPPKGECSDDGLGGEMDVRATDVGGRLYAAGPPYARNSGASRQADSVSIRRWVPGAATCEVVGWLRLPPGFVKFEQ